MVLQEGRITHDALEQFKRRVGTKLRISWQFNEMASREVIRNCVYGIGDPNILWVDKEYAGHTRYRTIVAPPYWLYSVFPTYVQQGLPGVHAFHSGNDWEFYKPVLMNDCIKPECIFTGFEVKSSSFAGMMVMEYQEARYYNQRQEMIARAKTWIVRTERAAARKKRKYSQLELPHPWTEEELRCIEDEALAEQIRGSEVRYWEDVKVGEELAPIVKGPLGITDELAFFAGWGGIPLKAHGLAFQVFRQHPSWSFRDPETCALEPIAGVHWNKAAANAAGLPLPYHAGVQSQSWTMELLLNWMGDEGWLKRNYAEYRHFVYFSDVIWLKGKVTKKYCDENGDFCVDIETNGINQRGENAIPGYSTVILPSREAHTWPTEKL